MVAVPRLRIFPPRIFPAFPNSDNNLTFAFPTAEKAFCTVGTKFCTISLLAVSTSLVFSLKISFTSTEMVGMEAILELINSVETFWVSVVCSAVLNPEEEKKNWTHNLFNEKIDFQTFIKTI